MHLYHLTLQSPQSIRSVVLGNFSGVAQQQEAVVVRGSGVLEMWSVSQRGLVTVLATHAVFGVIRSVVSFRLPGTERDYLVVGSDSGKLAVLQWDPKSKAFAKLHMEMFGKTGCRRVVPGQYLAADPRGRAVMIAATQKHKLIYLLNRDATLKTTVSSPLEANRSGAIVFSLVGVDVGYDNPIFAAIETDCSEADLPGAVLTEDQLLTVKSLTYYELDLGLNHATRKWSVPVDFGSNLLVALPGAADGPGGVLVCSEDYVSFRDMHHPNEVRCLLPRRRGLADDQPILVVCSCVFNAGKGIFFVFLQSEYGDIYRVFVTLSGDQVSQVRVKYFDTLPVASSMSITRAGVLIVASEFGSHAVYKFVSMGDAPLPDDCTTSSDMNLNDPAKPFFFSPRADHLHIVLIDKFDSLAPITDVAVADMLGEGLPQIVCTSGRGARSSLRLLRHGQPVTPVSVERLDGTAVGVWTVRQTSRDVHPTIIVLSFVNATMVLAVGEGGEVEEVVAGAAGIAPMIATEQRTLHVAQMGEDGVVQVTHDGFRYMRHQGQVQVWRCPPARSIVAVTTNQRQLVLALQGGSLVYFEVDGTTASLVESGQCDVAGEVAALNVGTCPSGRQRFRWLAVGTKDGVVRLQSLDPSDCLSQSGLLALPLGTTASSVVIASIGGVTFLCVGLSSGVLWRSSLDVVTGTVNDSRSTKLLGVKPITLSRMTLEEGQEAVIACCSRLWMIHSYHNRVWTSPLSYDALEFASGFSSPFMPLGLVGTSSTSVHFLSLDRLGSVFDAVSLPLRYTPREMVVAPQWNSVFIVECDHNSASSAAAPVGDSVDHPSHTVPPLRPGSGKWASCIRVVAVGNDRSSPDASLLHTTDIHEMGLNDAAVSLCLITSSTDHVLCVGVGKDLTLYPTRSCRVGLIYSYRIVPVSSGGDLTAARKGVRLELMHMTECESLPYAMCAFEGHLVVGIGKVVRMYTLGKKKLLRKCETRSLPNLVVSIASMGDRLWVGDVTESVFVLKYRHIEVELLTFCDETTPRWITAMTPLDYQQVAAADKFGNIFVLRIPESLTKALAEDPSEARLRYDPSLLGGAAHKLDCVAMIHIGETANAITKAALVPGGSECILYSTVCGTLGVLIPFTSPVDLDLFTHLEMTLRGGGAGPEVGGDVEIGLPPLCGRNHLAFRSYYQPAKAIIDGDLCEQFCSASSALQRTVAQELDTTPADIIRKIEAIRNILM